MSTPTTAPLALTLDELQQPTHEQSARLLELAKQIYKAKPWKKLEEEEVFIVRNPADDALLFVGAIGGAGEQAGVIIYRGAESYFGLLDFLERANALPPIPQMAEGMEGADELMSMLADALSQANFNPMELMQLPQLQLMFEPRDQLEETDEAWIARHNYKATGKGFPTFRGVSSGFLPWWISDGEADAMIVALEQLLEVTGRKDFSEDLVEVKEIEKGEDFALELFARVPTKDAKGAITWSDERLEIEPDTSPKTSQIALDAEQVAHIAALPASKDVIEIGLLGMPAPFGDAENRPFFPTLLVMGHAQQMIANEMLQSGFGAALALPVADVLVQQLAQRPARPQKLQFSSPDLEFLKTIGADLGIEIEEVEELKTLDPVLEMLAAQIEEFDIDDLSEEELAELEAEMGEGDLPKFMN